MSDSETVKWEQRVPVTRPASHHDSRRRRSEEELRHRASQAEGRPPPRHPILLEFQRAAVGIAVVHCLCIVDVNLTALS
jgi:hypothetical protein